ncbi:toxin-antitoxin system HicB family antitoxin [Gallaecimonas kandeliae]|uniref:type II toxin-antitoxin system HicB family antitoxin n=1 Tax=Gallaecimonas kandeliae TaxID=3029055 RepID=UPI00264A4CD7|nr:toxin-antitoxin system HicB family antitoxin [Gallaecimonas kandeliae]WKE67261.1 toxin-antitoxin system HicB family antitoxin [Gallaecimonas kandeliae]
MVNFDHYTYRVTWSEDDQEFVGLCAEFPSLSCLDETKVGAFEGIGEVVRAVIEELVESGEPVPQPYSERKYSGNFQVRLLPEQHRALAIEAAETGVSLNRLVCAKLST